MLDRYSAGSAAYLSIFSGAVNGISRTKTKTTTTAATLLLFVSSNGGGDNGGDSFNFISLLSSDSDSIFFDLAWIAVELLSEAETF